MNLRRRDSTTVFFGKLKIFKMEDIYILSGSIFMYKFINKLLPPMFDNFFKVNHSVHKYNTRQSDYLHTPIFKSFLGSTCIRCKGVKLWTDAVNNISWKGKIGSFKTQLKIHILSKYYVCENWIVLLLVVIIWKAVYMHTKDNNNRKNKRIMLWNCRNQLLFHTKGQIVPFVTNTRIADIPLFK